MDETHAPKFRQLHKDDDFELLLNEDLEMIHLRFFGRLHSAEHARLMTDRLIQVVRDTVPQKRVVVVQDMRAGDVPMHLFPIVGRGLIPLGESYTKAIIRYGRSANFIEKASVRIASSVAGRPIHLVDSWRDVLDLVEKDYPAAKESA